MKIFKVTNTTGWSCIINAESLMHAKLLFFKGHYLFGTEDDSNFLFELLHEIPTQKNIFEEHIKKIEDKIKEKQSDSNLRLLIYQSLDASNLPIEEIKTKVEEILTYIKTGK